MRVAAGQFIAYVGDSGNAEWTGSHTHFELHRNERPINPYRYLVEAYDRAAIEIQTIEVEARVDELCLPGAGGPTVDAQLCEPLRGPLPEDMGAPIFD